MEIVKSVQLYTIDMLFHFGIEVAGHHGGGHFAYSVIYMLAYRVTECSDCSCWDLAFR